MSPPCVGYRIGLQLPMAAFAFTARGAAGALVTRVCCSMKLWLLPPAAGAALCVALWVVLSKDGLVALLVALEALPVRGGLTEAWHLALLLPAAVALSLTALLARGGLPPLRRLPLLDRRLGALGALHAWGTWVNEGVRLLQQLQPLLPAARVADAAGTAAANTSSCPPALTGAPPHPSLLLQ